MRSMPKLSTIPPPPIPTPIPNGFSSNPKTVVNIMHVVEIAAAFDALLLKPNMMFAIMDDDVVAFRKMLRKSCGLGE